MPRGSVKTYHKEKGWGYISSPQEVADVFFHVDDVLGEKEPSQGQSVEFQVEHAPRGPRASRIRLL